MEWPHGLHIRRLLVGGIRSPVRGWCHLCEVAKWCAHYKTVVGKWHLGFPLSMEAFALSGRMVCTLEELLVGSIWDALLAWCCLH